jgi:HAMP domain-containing protein
MAVWHERNLKEKLTVIFMLVAIFLAMVFGAESLLNGRREAFASELLSRRQVVVAELAARVEPQLYLARSILPLLRLYSENGKADLLAVRQAYLQEKGLDLAFYQFDNRGTLLQTAPAGAPNQWLMRNLFAAMRETDLKKMPQHRRSLDKKLEFAFGYGKDLNSILENPESLISTVFSGNNGIITWSSRPEGGLIVVCQQLPTDADIFRTQLRDFKKLEGLQQVGLLNQNYSDDQSLGALAKKNLGASAVDGGSFAGRFWTFVSLRSAKTIFAAFSEHANPYIRIQQMTRLLFLALAAALTLLILIAGQSSTISLKKLVISMFFASSLLPLSGIALTAIDNLDVYTRIHTNKVRSAKEETLRNVVQNFNRYLASCSNSLLKMTTDPGAGARDPKTVAMVKNVENAFPGARIVLRNAAGEPMYYNGTERSAGRETVFKSVARRILERYAPERLDEMKYSGNPFSDALVRKDDMGFGTMLNFPDRLQFISTGNSDFLLFFRLLPASVGSCTMVMVELSTFSTIKSYLKTLQAKPMAIDGAALQMAAFYPEGFRWSLPPLAKQQRNMLALAETAYATGKAQFQRYYGNESGFALCLPVAELADNCLVAFCSATPLDDEISRMKRNIVLAALLALVLIASIAFWLSSQLLAPLARLGHGITALSERNFEVRLPTLTGKDEFTSLFAAFNEMMAESYDMQIAHNVQEGLVPSEFPKLADYSMFGMLQPASDLGGDCLDCFALPDGKLLFLVGDITGHGVGSALIMAFSRAITFHWSQTAQLSPVSLTDQIDHMLRENRTQRMFMGIICGVLDVETNRVELVVKGHIYPLKVRADNTTEWVGLPAFPLGIGKPSHSQSVSIEMAPGDALLCMTDGFLEAYNRRMRPIGFDGIETWAVETRSEDAKVWVEMLEKRFQHWCDNQQSDDISIFILTRKGAD